MTLLKNAINSTYTSILFEKEGGCQSFLNENENFGIYEKRKRFHLCKPSIPGGAVPACMESGPGTIVLGDNKDCHYKQRQDFFRDCQAHKGSGDLGWYLMFAVKVV